MNAHSAEASSRLRIHCGFRNEVSMKSPSEIESPK